MFWAIDKENKCLYLCGTELYINDYVQPKDCNCILPYDKVKNYFDYLLINPFNGYKFMFNKEKHEKLLFFRIFPYGVTNFLIKDEVDKGIIGSFICYSSGSTNDLVAFFESFFQAVGYKTKSCRLDYNTEKEMKEDGYEPAYYYGGGRGCALFVKKV